MIRLRRIDHLSFQTDGNLPKVIERERNRRWRSIVLEEHLERRNENEETR